jgi:DNA-binding NtrC family response regulator
MKKRSRKSRKLETVFNAVTTPLFLLDARRVVQFFNFGCEELTGWSATDVVGTVCDYATGSDPADVETLTGRLAPPPAVLDGREASVPTEFLCRDGKRVTRMLHFFPLVDEDGRVRSIVGIAVPIRDPERAVESSPARKLHAELAAQRSMLRQRFGQGSLVGGCSAMLRVFRQIELAAASHAGVCIHGATGSGREHAARSIHLQSELHNRAFVPLDCRRLTPPELKQALVRLLEATADVADTGTVRSLQPGTLYFANVEALPRDLQQMIVDSQKLTSETGASSDPRVVASTQCEIDDLRRNDALIDELFFRLTAICIELPPLNDRGDDLQLLGQALLEEMNRDDEKQIGGFGDEVWRLFRQYNWPGNIDEFRQVISEAHAACSGELIQVSDLPFRFRTGLDAQAVGPAVEPQELPLQELLEQVEADRIRLVLEQTRYNKTKTAQLLGIPRPRLYRRMEALGIEDLEGEG